jgi:cadmium resistance protein CadD (predicted permease)
MDILAIIMLASAAFFATNLDNLILLTTFLNRYKEKKPLVYTGYILAISIAIGGSYAAGTLIDELPLEYLGYLGSIPLLLGLYGLWQLFLNQELDAIAHHRSDHRLIVPIVALSQFSNSSDSMITFSIIYADTRSSLDWLITATLFTTAVLFALLASIATDNRVLGQRLDKYAPYFTPFILIYVGAYVLMNTSSDVIAG